ncbi:hypothetical protein [Chitinophaga cymbidii]|uniref:Uncharacterized protein n=1 Tax=Chitinophaga cymbidii TaxID=1096750 RepID=A0A512RG54_9BACT|nr:hypothetical protein [Chitinophaga cymbidii]GEP94682.1 hypothetical protein CCY01nite_09420 [Chitinophaga cymbidii]
MEQTKSFVREEAVRLKRALDNFIEFGVKSEHSFDINCEILRNYLIEPVDTSEQFKDLFDKLKSMSGPCIYWADIVGEKLTNVQIVEAMRKYDISNNETGKRRQLPVIYKRIRDSRTLYVGKVNGGIWARVLTHFGYHLNGNLQGLQLYHWAKDLGLVIRFNILEFDGGCLRLLPAIEYEIAKQKSPLIGSHSS